MPNRLKMWHGAKSTLWMCRRHCLVFFLSSTRPACRSHRTSNCYLKSGANIDSHCAMVKSNRSHLRGQCRCGAFAYESKLSKTQLAFKCNCSLCVKKGYLWVFPGQNNFKIVQGSESTLVTYKFGPSKLSHKVRGRTCICLHGRILCSLKF